MTALILIRVFPVSLSAEQTHASFTLETVTFTAFQEAADDGYDCRIDLKPADDTDTFDEVDIVFAYHGPADYCRFRWNASGWRLTQSAAGECSRLNRDEVGGIPDALRHGARLILRSRPHVIEIVADSRIVLRTLAHGRGAGTLAFATGPGHAQVTGARIQRVAPFVFGEDFSRSEEETDSFGVWEPLSGDWQFHSVAKDIESKPELKKRDIKPGIVDRIANPFSLSGSSATTNEALIITGHSFWNDYDTAVSVKTWGGDVGLAFGVTDQDNLWYVRCAIANCSLTAAPLELVKRVNGIEHVAASTTVVARTDNWYRLSVRAVGSRIDVCVDGQRVISVRDAQSVGGAVGLIARGEGPAHFDDVDVQSVESVKLDIIESAAPFDETLSGTWTHADQPGVVRFSGKRDSSGAVALRMLGSRQWSPSSFEARVDLAPTAASAGLVFAESTPTNQWRLVWEKHGGGRLVLSRFINGIETDRQDAPLVLNLPGSLRLRVDRTDGDRLKCYVDGELQLMAHPVSPLTGRVGLLADTTVDAVFSDVEINRVPVSDWERPIKVGVFADDPYMQGWASPRHAWSPVEQSTTNSLQVYRHKGDFYGALSVRGPLTAGLSVRFGSDDIAAGDGYEVHYTFAEGPDAAEVRLDRAGRSVARATFQHGPRQILSGQRIINEKLGPLALPPDTVSYGTWSVHREGKYIWVTASEHELICYRDPEPLTGRALGLATHESLDLAQVDVRRDRVKDYQFERAGCAWTKVGTWEVTNRFSCDPRWSHMNGRSRGVAALWNKLDFAGDYTLEYYAGMRMRQGDMLDTPGLYYPRVGDINVALCANDHDLFSGYNLIIAAWDTWWSERWTRFLRCGELVQQTEKELLPRTRDGKPSHRAVEVGWDPGGRPVHGAWYFIKIRKTGSHFDVWFDDAQVFDFDDPDPLAGRRLALWTQDNSIVLARVRISYRKAPEHSSQQTSEGEANQERAIAPEPETAVAFNCPSHPGRHFDFETGRDGWRSALDDQGARVELIERGDGRGGHSLRLTNRYGGGSFESVVPLPRMDLARVETVAFDCAIPPDVRVNLYVRIKGRSHERCYVTLSGPNEETANLVRLGRFTGFKADGQWQRVRFPLGQALRRRFPDRKTLILEEMSLGYHHGGYLNAGLGGNGTGAHYAIDNFTVASTGPATATLCRTGEPGPRSYAYTVRSFPDATATDLKPLQAATNTVPLGTAVTNVIHVFQDLGGTYSKVCSIPVHNDRPLTVSATSPRDGEAWDLGTVSVQFSTNTSASLIPVDLSLTANGRELPVGAFWDAYSDETKILRLDPNPSGLTCDQGEPVAFELTFKDTVGDRLSTNAPTVFRWTAIADLTQDRTPPGPVELAIPGIVNMRFDHGMDGAKQESSTSTVRLERQRRGSSGGDYALSLINNVCGSDLGLVLGIKTLDAGRFPLLEFDYRLIPEARVDLCVGLSKGNQAVGLNDVSAGRDKGGVIEDVCADGAWHHAAFDLGRMIAAAQNAVTPQDYAVRELGFKDDGYAASPPGAWYSIDNVRTVPIIKTLEGTPLPWTAMDAGGISGYSYVWSQEAESPVDETPETTSASAVFADVAEGERFFHIRACDRAGNWGPTTHHRILVDNSPPVVATLSPAAGTGSATSALRVVFGPSLAQLDFHDARLILNGEACALESSHASVAPERSELTWRWVDAARRMSAPLPDGHTMSACLSGLRDFAGNTMSPVTWNWHIDYASDRNGPAPPTLTCWTQHMEQFDDFSQGTHPWRVYDPEDNTAEIATEIDPDTGDSCLRLTKTARTSRYGAYAFRGTLDIDDYDCISFDYKIPAGVNLNMQVYVNGDWKAVLLTGNESLPALGHVEGVKADGCWHHALINLPGMLQKAMPDGGRKERQVRYIMFGNWQFNGNPVGASVFVDNFAILKTGLPLPEISCASADATGIRGHAFAMTRDPRTVPTVQSSDAFSRMMFPVLDESGMWFIHVRARDGAGNWGATRHYPYYCSAPMPPNLNAGDGEESSGCWGLTPGDKRTVCELRQTHAASGTNAMLLVSLRTWKADVIRIRREETNRIPRTSTMTATFFNQGRTDLKLAPYVCLENGAEPLVGTPLDLPAGHWLTDAQLTLTVEAATGPTDGGPMLECRERGLLLYAPHRARSHVIMDQIREGGRHAQP